MKSSKIKKFPVYIRMSHILLTWTFIFLLTIPEQGNGQYSYQNPVYSSSSSGVGGQSDTSLGSSSSSNSGGGVGDTNLGELNAIDQSQRSNKFVAYSPSPAGGGQQSMYYYEMYPQYSVPKLGQKCTYTDKGMVCKQRRDGGGEDSYIAAAGSGHSNAGYGKGYGSSSSGGWSQPSGGWSSDDDDNFDISQLKEYIGLLGLLGLKGLKGLKGVGILKAAALPFLPIILPLLPLLPLLLPVLLLLPLLLLLFIPIPVVVAGGTGRRSFKDIAKQSILSSNIAKLTLDILESEECLERLSCEVGRVSRKSGNWVERFRLAEYLPKESQFTSRVKRGLNLDSQNNISTKNNESNNMQNCVKFTCSVKTPWNNDPHLQSNHT